MIRNKKEIVAFLPGTIIDVLVQAGQDIKAGQPLVILDAMKMHNRIASSTDGRVKAVKVQVGDRVPKNCVMVELE